MVKKISTFVLALCLLMSFLPVNAADSVAAPAITFDTIKATGIVDQEDLSAFTVSVAESITVSDVTLRIDGRVVSSDSIAPYTFNVSLAELGSHKAEAIVLDTAGTYHRESAWFNLATYTHASPIGSDFEGFTSHPTDGAYGSVSAIAATNATYSPVARDEEDATAGNCLLIDAATGTSPEQYLQKTLSGSNMDKLVYSTVDFKFTNASSSAYISLKDRSGNNSTFFHVSAGGSITVGGVSAGILEDPTDTWHTISILVNQKLGVEDVRIDGDLIARNARPYDNGGIAASTAGLMRLWYRGYDGTDILIDNFYTNMVSESVYATGEAATYGENSVSFTTSRALADNVTTANFSLESELGAAEIESVTLGDNKLVTITTKEALEPANSYVLKIKSGTPLADGTTITTNTRYVFNTTARETDWLTGDICPITEGYIFSGTVANATGGTLKAVCAITDAAGVFLSCKIVPVAADGTFSVRGSAGHDMKVKGFIVDADWNPISDKFYTATIH